MKAINVVYTLIGIVILGLLVWVIYTQVNRNKTTNGSPSRGSDRPLCIHEYPDGTTVSYPCGTVPPPQTSRVVVFTPNQYPNPELIRNGKNVGNTTV